MYCEHIDQETKQVFGLTNKQYDGYVEVGEIEVAYNGLVYLKGYAPQPSIDYQNEQIRQQRQARYEAESDPIRLDYDEALARGEESAETLKEEWLASKDKIREELPYIIGE